MAAMFYQNVNRNEFEKLVKIRDTQKSLPIAEYRRHILDTLKENQVLILAGDTGCGKSTQVSYTILFIHATSFVLNRVKYLLYFLGQ